MTTFKQISGQLVRSYTSDPDNPQEGQMWYNQTSLSLKGVVASAAWSSGGNLIAPRNNMGGAGDQTAALSFGGRNPPPAIPGHTSTDEYNGSGWSAGGALNTGRFQLPGAGTQTAGLGAGGYVETGGAQTVTEEYNGTSWTEVNDLSTARFGLGGAGTQTAAIVAGGRSTPGAFLNATEEWDGTNWTSGGSLNQSKTLEAQMTGTQTATVAFGGNTSVPASFTSNVEEYDGTSWSEVNNLPAVRNSGAASGPQTSSLIFAGGIPSVTGTSFTYDGTNFTASATMATARTGLGAAGATSNNSTGLGFGGYIGGSGYTSGTEEYNFSASVITPAAWSAGGNLSTARQRTGGFGSSQTSAVVAAGATSPPASALSATEEYDGSAWSSSGNVNTARFNMTAFGTEPAGVLSGIGTPSVSYGGTTEEYNGSTWTTVTPYNAPGANYRSSCGIQTAGLLAGGVSPSPAEHTNAVEEYDGTTWTSATNLPQYQAYNCQAGTQTAAINGGGNSGPNATTVNTNSISLEYNGSTWTAGPNANLFANKFTAFNGGIGTQTSAIFSGGLGTDTARYDGTTFATDASIAAARDNLSAAGNSSASAGIVYCGSPVPGVGNTVDEYSAETTSTNVKTFTTS